MDKHEYQQFIKKDLLTYYDVSDRVRSWGRRGILGGGLFGFALGVVFIAIPQTVKVLAFGVAGTLLVTAVEGAVIAGAVSACAAALCSKGARYGKTARASALGHHTRNVGRQDGDIPLSTWPTRWAYPNSTTAQPAFGHASNADTPEQALRRVRARLTPWENGNTGP